MDCDDAWPPIPSNLLPHSETPSLVEGKSVTLPSDRLLRNALDDSDVSAAARALGFAPPYFPERLLEIALGFEAALPGAGSGLHSYRLHAFQGMAMWIAARMEAQSLPPVQAIGPFRGAKFTKGDRLKIRTGALISSTSKRLCRTLNRSYSVTVHSFSEGYFDEFARDELHQIQNPQVHWIGTGGYWCWTDVNNMEPVPAKPAELCPPPPAPARIAPDFKPRDL